MDENTYEHECMRAELLGTEKPDLEEYLKHQKEKEAAQVQEDETDIENLREGEKGKEEDLRNISGGLHELGSILSATQRKLNRFKVSCGSLTNLLKIKVGNTGSTESIVLSSSSKNAQEVAGLDNTSMSESPKKENDEPHNSNPKKSDLAKALDNHVDKLDLLIEKAEVCQISMSQQNKQMKKFLH